MEHSVKTQDMLIRHGVPQILWACLIFSALFHGLTFLFLSPAPGSIKAGRMKLELDEKLVTNRMLTVVALGSNNSEASKTNFTLPPAEASVMLEKATRSIANPRLLEGEASTASTSVASLSAAGSPQTQTPGVILQSPLAQPEHYYRGSEVDCRAEMLLPMELSYFEEEFALSGSLRMDIFVRKDGTVERIELLNIADVSGALRQKLLPFLNGGTYSPALKNGQAVNSIKTMEFDLAARVDLRPITSKTLAGFRPKLDEKGNIAPNQDLSLMPKIP